MFNKEDIEAVLMVKTSHAFNSINRENYLHNSKLMSPSLSIYINNRHSSPTDLYNQGSRSIKSEEGI